LFKFESQNNHVIFLTGKNIKLSQFIQHDKNKSQPPLTHIHRELIIGRYSLSSERLVDIKITKSNTEKVQDEQQ
jgi:hypothetical protein